MKKFWNLQRVEHKRVKDTQPADPQLAEPRNPDSEILTPYRIRYQLEAFWSITLLDPTSFRCCPLVLHSQYVFDVCSPRAVRKSPEFEQYCSLYAVTLQSSYSQRIWRAYRSTLSSENNFTDTKVARAGSVTPSFQRCRPEFRSIFHCYRHHHVTCALLRLLSFFLRLIATLPE